MGSDSKGLVVCQSKAASKLRLVAPPVGQPEQLGGWKEKESLSDWDIEIVLRDGGGVGSAAV